MERASATSREVTWRTRLRSSGTSSGTTGSTSRTRRRTSGPARRLGYCGCPGASYVTAPRTSFSTVATQRSLPRKSATTSASSSLTCPSRANPGAICVCSTATRYAFSAALTTRAPRPPTSVRFHSSYRRLQAGLQTQRGALIKTAREGGMGAR